MHGLLHDREDRARDSRQCWYSLLCSHCLYAIHDELIAISCGMIQQACAQMLSWRAPYSFSMPSTSMQAFLMMREAHLGVAYKSSHLGVYAVAHALTVNVTSYLRGVPDDELAGAQQLQHAFHIHASLPPLLQVLKALLAKVPIPHH